MEQALRVKDQELVEEWAIVRVVLIARSLMRLKRKESIFSRKRSQN
jgi:hypothetical protein